MSAAGGVHAGMSEAEYDFWRRALAGERLLVHADEPQCGFYRLQSRDGAWLPVAIWRGPDGLLALRDGEPCNPDDVWLWAHRHPVSYADYNERTMGRWPHEPEVSLRHNEADDPCEQVAAELAELEAMAEGIAPDTILDQSAADRAATVRDTLLALARRAEDERAAEKRPHDEAVKAVQARWRPVIDRADALNRRLRDAVAAFLIAKRSGGGSDRAVHAGGFVGRRVALRTIRRAIITDQDALYAALRHDPSIAEALRKIADRIVRAGGALPGVTIHEERTAS